MQRGRLIGGNSASFAAGNTGEATLAGRAAFAIRRTCVLRAGRAGSSARNDGALNRGVRSNERLPLFTTSERGLYMILISSLLRMDVSFSGHFQNNQHRATISQHFTHISANSFKSGDLGLYRATLIVTHLFNIDTFPQHLAAGANFPLQKIPT